MEPTLHQFREPMQCVYWDDPKTVRSTPISNLDEAEMLKNTEPPNYSGFLLRSTSIFRKKPMWGRCAARAS
jgi:hypothetical protein